MLPASLPRLPPWLSACLPSWRQAVLLLTPLVMSPLALTGKEGRCAFVTVVMSAYYMCDVVPIPVTALIPVFAFPLLGVLSTGEVSNAYVKGSSMMFLGGLIVASAVEHSGLHKRIALIIVLTLGISPRRLMTGFMVTTMFLSMWISNTATTAMMVPIVDAVLQELYKNSQNGSSGSNGCVETPMTPMTWILRKSTAKINVEGMSKAHYNQKNNCAKDGINTEENTHCSESVPAGFESDAQVESMEPQTEECRKLRDMFYLATAYASNLGGTGAISGTTPNLPMMAVMDEFFPDTNVISFTSWLMYSVPGMLLCGVLAWLWLQFFFIGFRKNNAVKTDRERDAAIKKILQEKYRALGGMSFHEMVVLTFFSTLVLLWVFLSPGFMPGWSDYFRTLYPDIKITDGTPAIFIVFLLFIIPRKPKLLSFLKGSSPESLNDEGKDSKLACLTWKVVHEKVPWGIVILLGGGFAMAEASKKSNMSDVMGKQLLALEVLPKEAIVFLVSLFTAGFTEVASGTATASVLVPILKDLCISIRVNPIYLMFPATLCCSYAFMLPVGTPTNAIVFEASKMKSITMIKAGLGMNVICVCVVTLMINTWGIVVFDINNFPAWADVGAINGSTSGIISHTNITL